MAWRELEAKATEKPPYSTFEALFKSADWYEKKVQTQMQAALEKGTDQASASLREKAGELSGLFASELDHYSRSYVEHAQSHMQENGRDLSERVSLQIKEAGDAAATNFTDRAEQLGRHQLRSPFRTGRTRRSNKAPPAWKRIPYRSVRNSKAMPGLSRQNTSAFSRNIRNKAFRTPNRNWSLKST